MLANPDSYCEIDPEVVDEFGIPVLRFHFKWSDNEIRQAQDMQETFKAIVEAMGGEYKTRTDRAASIPLASKPAGELFTRSARRAWALIPRLPC